MNFDQISGIFDSHAHYYDKRFAEEYPGGADALLSRILPETVSHIINVGTNPETSALAMEQAERYDGMFFAVGIHPEDCLAYADMAEALSEIEAFLKARKDHPKLVALGEIGLDYHAGTFFDGTLDRKKEADFFDAQLTLAERYDLPVIIHDREAHGDCFDRILQHPGVRGVFHSYSGSAEMAKDLVRRGWYLSFSGTLTFKNAPKVREAALAIPRERLLIETDAPYLAPHPVRGSLNHSGLLVYTVATLAQLWNCREAEVVEITSQNAKRLFLG